MGCGVARSLVWDTYCYSQPNFAVIVSSFLLAVATAPTVVKLARSLTLLDAISLEERSLLFIFCGVFRQHSRDCFCSLIPLIILQEIVPIMDLAVNEEFTRMYSEEELLGARRIQVRRPYRVEQLIAGAIICMKSCQKI